MPKLPYLDFKQVYPLAEILDLAQMLNLNLKGGATLRCSCPVHGGDERALCVTPGVMSHSGSLGVYKCWASGEKGGDRIGLVAHVMELSQQEAAHVIQEHFGTVETVPNRATVPRRDAVPDRDNVPVTPRQVREEPQPRQQAPSHPFDPEKFASKLVWHEEVAKLGLTEDTAASLGCGYHPQRKAVFFAVKHADGTPSGFIGVKEGRVQLPPQWLPATGNVVKLRRA